MQIFGKIAQSHRGIDHYLGTCAAATSGPRTVSENQPYARETFQRTAAAWTRGSLAKMMASGLGKGAVLGPALVPQRVRNNLHTNPRQVLFFSPLAPDNPKSFVAKVASASNAGLIAGLISSPSLYLLAGAGVLSAMFYGAVLAAALPVLSSVACRTPTIEMTLQDIGGLMTLIAHAHIIFYAACFCEISALLHYFANTMN